MVLTRPAVRADLGTLEGYHSPQVDVAVRLNTNESPLPPPPAWRAALADELAGIEWNRYPDRGARALRSAIGGLHGVAPEQVFAANGSNEVIQALCLAYGGPGRRAVVFEPTYRLHSHIAALTGTEVVTRRRGPDLGLDPAEVEAALDGDDPAILFLCSPNNPTGMLEDPDLVREVAGRSGGVVAVVDEAYGQFSPWSALELVGEDRPVVVTRTYSKTWSMAAARLGYLVGPSWLVAELDRVALPYHLDSVKQAAGRLALRFGAEMQARVAALVAERGRLVAGLEALGVEQWPSSANFVLFRPERGSPAVWEELVARSVLVRDCSSWPGLEGCQRVTVGTEEEDDAFLGALAEVLRGGRP